MKPTAIIVTINSQDYVVDSLSNAVWGGFNWRLLPISDSNFKVNYDPIFLTKKYATRIKKSILNKVISLYKIDKTFRFYVLDEKGMLHEL